MYTLSVGSVPLFVSSNKPYTPESVLASVTKFKNYLYSLPFEKQGILKDMMLVTIPSILEGIIAMGPEAIQTLARDTGSIMYAGAPLPVVSGNKLAEKGAVLHNLFGM